MALPAANPRVPFEVVFVDEHVLVVSKPRGRVTLPGRGHERDSLLNGVFARYGTELARLGAKRDYGLLHRLDRATSGLVAIARTAEAYDHLREAFATRRVEKVYLTIVHGRPPRPRGTARLRLQQVRRGELLVSVVDPRGLEAVTHWEQIQARGAFALLTCRIETGRLHQIRAHLAALGCPIEGDTVYRAGSAPDSRASVARSADRSLLLHAWCLTLPHPARRKPLRVRVDPPADFRRRAAELGLDAGEILGRVDPGSRKRQ